MEIVALKEEEETQVQEAPSHDLEVHLLNLRESLTLRVRMPSLIKKKLKRSYNRNFMKILGLQMR